MLALVSQSLFWLPCYASFERHWSTIGFVLRSTFYVFTCSCSLLHVLASLLCHSFLCLVLSWMNSVSVFLSFAHVIQSMSWSSWRLLSLAALDSNCLGRKSLVSTMNPVGYVFDLRCVGYEVILSKCIFLSCDFFFSSSSSSSCLSHFWFS